MTRSFWRIGTFVLLLAMCVPSAVAQKSPKDTFEFPPLNPIEMPTIETVKLANGLRVFLVEDHDFPTIDIRAVVRIGSVFESAQKIGLAGIAGTVLRSGGTNSRSGDEIDRELESLAATIETYIGQNSGGFMASMLKEDVDRVLSILTDILVNPAFREDKIDLAKIQRRSGISRRNDEVSEIARREFWKLIYGPTSPYARHAEYTTIDAISREDIIRFYERGFYPNNAIMTVWGDFVIDEMVEKLKDTLGTWHEGTSDIPAQPKVDYEYKYTVNLIDKPDVNQSNISLGHIGGLMSNPDYPALSVMNNILSWERMFKKIRTDEGLAYSVWGTYGASFRYPGVFSCAAQTKSESTVYAIELMREEVRRITREEVSDDELTRAKERYLNTYVFNFDSKAKIVNRLMTYSYNDYPLDFMETIKTGVEKVTKADVLRVAKKYLRPDKVQILVIGNKKAFDKPLSSLGEVNVIDITIPPAKGKKQ
ncbi:MAG: pitrilysin family protein [Candidatus Aminicenantes bacterium]